MKWLFPGLLFGLAIGCNQSSAPTSGSTAATDRSNSVTANKPVVNEYPNTQPVERTNTGVNVRDRDAAAKTSFDQNENTADIKTTADIRKRVVAEQMSSNAHNVKIITQDGKVTLRGPVTTDDEKQKIEQIATDVAGNSNVDNQLEVNNK